MKRLFLLPLSMLMFVQGDFDSLNVHGATAGIDVVKDGNRTAAVVVDSSVTAPASRIGHVGAFLGSVTGAPDQEMHGYIFFPTMTLAATGTTTSPLSGVAFAAPLFGGGTGTKAAVGATVLIESNPPSGLCTTCYSLLVDAGISAFDGLILQRTAGTGIEMNAAGELPINASNGSGTIGFYTAGVPRGGIDATGGWIVGSGGTPIKKQYSGTNSLDFNLSALGITCQDLTITVTGAATGDAVKLGMPDALASTTGVTFDAWVSSANTVKVRACDVTSGNPNPAAATVRAEVTHY